MKSVLAFSLILILLLTMQAKAEELPQPGWLPDNPLYIIKRIGENVKLWLTFDPATKANLRLEIAATRLAELNATIESGKLQYVEKLREEYEWEINETEKEFNVTLGLGRNETALAEHICNMTYKHVTVLQRVLEKAPESAKLTIEGVINASVERHENCIENILDKINKTEESFKWKNCTSDAECLNLNITCPAFLERNITCYIPANQTEGTCLCLAKWKLKILNCTADSECRDTVCPMILDNDTAICLNGNCSCGTKWQLRNRTEWMERFGETLTEKIEGIQEKINEKIQHRSGKD